MLAMSRVTSTKHSDILGAMKKNETRTNVSIETSRRNDPCLTKDFSKFAKSWNKSSSLMCRLREEEVKEEGEKCIELTDIALNAQFRVTQVRFVTPEGKIKIRIDR